MPRVPMIAAVLLAAACKPTLDADGIEKAIAGFFAAQLGPVDRVACPDGDGHFALVEPVVATRVVTPRIAAWLKSQTGVDAAVDCGAGVQLLPATGYQCTAPRPDGSKATIIVRRDAAGELTWSVGP
jgi:hypothetical protein